MGQFPHSLDPGRHARLEHRRAEPWTRRIVVTLLAGVMVAALVGVFGQNVRERAVAAPEGTLRVSAPERVRGGLFFQGRFDVRATKKIADPRLVLATGWTEQLQVNTIEPAPDAERSDDGRLELRYGTLDPGARLTVWLQFEANPTGVGRRDQTVELRDGSRVLARLHRSLTVLP
jgi:hypothetical protein